MLQTFTSLLAGNLRPCWPEIINEFFVPLKSSSNSFWLTKTEFAQFLPSSRQNKFGLSAQGCEDILIPWQKIFQCWKYLCWTRPGTCLTNVLISITGPVRDHHHRQELGIFQIITLTMTADSSYIFWQFQIDLQILTPSHLVVFHSFYEWQVNSAIMLVMTQAWSGAGNWIISRQETQDVIWVKARGGGIEQVLKL